MDLHMRLVNHRCRYVLCPTHLWIPPPSSKAKTHPQISTILCTSPQISPSQFILPHKYCGCRLAAAAWGRSSVASYIVRPIDLVLPGDMGRSLLSIFLLLPLLFSVGHAALTFHDIWNLALPHSASPEEAVPDHLPHGELGSTLPMTGEAGDQGAGDVVDHSKARVDFGTKAWPYVYYARRDREGTLDWGTKSWPYIFYTKKEDNYGLAASSAAASAAAAGNYGRKAGDGFRL